MEEDLRTACDDACFRASLALDGALVDDVGLRRLRSHLDACPACARLVARMGLASALLRRAPPEPFRCELPRARLSLLPAVVRGLPSANGAYPRSVVPFRLPIGQRSAADDFMARSGTSSAAGDGADGADRDERIQ